MTAPDKIDSNLTGLSFAWETTPKVLPGTDGADAVWQALEPNSYSDFGGELKTIARNPINPSRQRKKGSPVGLDANGGYNFDLCQNNIFPLSQAFFFANAREKFDTAPLNGTAIDITAVDGTNNQFEAASGLDAVKVGALIWASGFTNAANNGLHRVTVVAAGALDVTTDLVAEASPPAAARLQVVGFQFATGDLTMTAAADGVTLGATAKDLTELGLNVGEWIHIGGDVTGEQFGADTTLTGYGRVKSVAAGAIVLDETTFTPATNTGTGKTIRLFVGKFLRNEKDPSLIVQKTIQLERTLGNDGDGVQAEYLPGAFANELTLTVPMEDKATVDVSFVAMDNEQRDGTEGVKDGTRVDALGEDCFNTSSNVYRSRIAPRTAGGTINQSNAFAYVSEATIVINNGVTKLGAVGVFGGFSASFGDFAVSGEVEAYFSTIEAVRAVRQNTDYEYNLILAKDNAGMIWDMPLIGLGGGRANVEKDQSIKLPLQSNAAENEYGYTLSLTQFAYLPTVGMPTV